jgi:PPK2 family polyphosphate:nucleotide phosphotransferase
MDRAIPADPARERAAMDYRNAYRVEPGAMLDLAAIDPARTAPHESHHAARKQIAACVERLADLQYRLYAEGRRSLLIVLQGLDAAGKDGTIRHVFTGLNPQGARVAAFREPTPVELAHDFLWRVHRATPAAGEIAIFNRSHYEDVVAVRVRGLVEPEIWRARFARIADFETLLAQSGTRVVKFFLHISREEQLKRFRKRLEDPGRQWKISESDYADRELWDDFQAAYGEALSRTSTESAPWFVIPADHKWHRNLVVAEIIAETLAQMDPQTPPPKVDLTDIRRRFHDAARRKG